MRLLISYGLLLVFSIWAMAADEDTTTTTSSVTADSTSAHTTDAATGSATTPSMSTTTPAGETTSGTTTTTVAPPTVSPLQCYTCAEGDCNEKVAIDCSKNGTINADALFNLKGYACYSIKITVNETERQKLGCISIPNGESACEAVRKELKLKTDDANDQCMACQTDLCNGSAMQSISVLTFLCLMLAKIFI